MPSNESSLSEPVHIDPSQWAFKPRKLRVVCIGAGFSGLILAYKLKHEQPLEFVDFRIYEKNSEVGGTWLENVYPGVGCDVPAHSYIFPFEPNPSWSKCYVGGAEIQEYILNTVQKYGLRYPIQFETRLISSIWNEETGKWRLQLRQGDGNVIDDEADILINASGILNQPTLPNVEGLDRFKGKVLHTGAWDRSYEYKGKRIGVIGNGSSGVQAVPALQPNAAKIINYIRNPTWISVNLCPDITRDGMGTNFEYTEEEKALYQNDPKAFLEHRKVIECSVNKVYSLMLTGSELNRFLSNATERLMRDRLSENPQLVEKLIPKYDIGCRRLSPGDGYLEALQQPNARVCFEAIDEITPRGIRTSSGEEDLDLIVCATGFDTSFIPRWEFLGRNGRRLDKEWKALPQAYFSICAAAAPNYFMFAGPNSPIGHGSVPQMLAWSADYILKWVQKIAREDIKSAAVTDSVVHNYNCRAQSALKNTVWSGGCNAWYNNGNAVTAMHPGSVLHFKEAISEIRGEHFDIRYNTSDPFAFLGNGELEWEREEGADLGFYLQQ